MTTKLERMLSDWFEAWNCHDVDRILSSVMDDVVFEALAEERVVRGKTDLRTFQNDTFSAFPDFKIDVKSLFTSGERVAVEYVQSGTFKNDLQPYGLKPTGKSFSMRCAAIAEVHGDKVKRFTCYYDNAVYLRLFGLIP